MSFSFWSFSLFIFPSDTKKKHVKNSYIPYIQATLYTYKKNVCVSVIAKRRFSSHNCAINNMYYR